MNIIAQMENAENKQRSDIALEKAKRMERKDIKLGHRYFNINGRTKVLIECDEHGEPTERGKRQLELMKKNLGV